MKRNKRCLCVLLLAVASGAGLDASSSAGDWLRKIPEKDRTRPNPLREQAEAAPAGGLLYRENCASCHGSQGQGLGRRPSLRTQRVHDATDGELQWLLRHGSLAHGMPSWSGLPEVQRWQLVSYLRTLPLDGPAVAPLPAGN